MIELEFDYEEEAANAVKVLSKFATVNIRKKLEFDNTSRYYLNVGFDKSLEKLKEIEDDPEF